MTRTARRFLAELPSYGLARPEAPLAPVTDSDLVDLPPPAQRYLRFMDVVGRPRDWSFRLSMRGRFRLKPTQRWTDAEMHQYNSRLDVARIFHIRIRVGLLPVVGRDTYAHGKGRMLVRLLDRVTVQDAQGPQFDLGELVTFLNDAVLIAPSFLLWPDVTWTPVNERSFDLELGVPERTVQARVLVDAGGAPENFIATDRFGVDPQDPKAGPVQAQWSTPVEGWTRLGDRPFPLRGHATWHFPGGDFTYAAISAEGADLAFNVPPG